MAMRALLGWVVMLVTLLTPSRVLSAATPGLQTTVRLLLSQETARAGETIWAGVNLRMAPDWHVYWENSGDSGIPTQIAWTLPPGWSAGDILWPVPERFESGGLITYGYHGEVMLLVPLSIGPNAAPSRVELKAKVSWLECISEKCVPGSGQVTAQLDIRDSSKASSDRPLLDEWRKKLPEAKPADFARAWWDTEGAGESVRGLFLEWSPGPSVQDADFYPHTSSNGIVRTATQKVEAAPGRLRLRKEVEQTQSNSWPAQVAGVLVEKSGGTNVKAYEVNLPIQGTASSAAGAAGVASAVAPLEKKPLLFWIGTAFLGGLILNLMPCVLPVIALKIFGFVAQSHESPARVRRLGLAYLVGVIASFLVLAGVVIELKHVGRNVSWGMQFGDARFLVIMTTLVVLMALNLFGLFEVTLAGDAMGKASALASREGLSGAFFNGALATLLSTSCSAPFLGLALGFALAQSAPVILVTFATIGLGLAAPYAILSFQPRWLKFLPKPGAWMEHFKVAMGFPVLATAVWLFYLTIDHYRDVLWLGFFLVLVALAAWVFGQFFQRGRTHRGLALTITLLLLAVGYGYGLERKQRWRTPPPPPTGQSGDEIIQDGPDGIPWRRWSPARVQQARAERRPVFVDFTAKWCPTCLANKNSSIEIDSVRKKLKEINAVPLIGDNTLFPPDIAEELTRFGTAAVPLVLVYPKDPSKPPMVLPPLLTPGIVLDALEKAAQ